MSQTKKPEKSSSRKKKPLPFPDQKPINSYARYSGLAFQMGVLIFAGVFGGIKLDEKVKLSFPLFTVIFSLLGVFISLYLVLREFIHKK